LFALASLKQNDKATSTSEKKHATSPGPPLTPLQRMVKGDEGPPRLDGSDKYFGFENVVKNGLQDDEVSYIFQLLLIALLPVKRMMDKS
jgi:hypothetical protein